MTGPSPSAARVRIAVVIPVLNDWSSLQQLICEIAQQDVLSAHDIHIVAVDDGSIDFSPPGSDLLRGPVRCIEIVRLKANLGHQRAIALGLAHAQASFPFDIAVVMDGDGEDRPEDLAALLQAHLASPAAIVVAERGERSEGALFRVFYQIYKFAFRRLTGKAISFGNFSLIPAARLDNVLYNPGIWNNFAATLLRSRVPIEFVATRRGVRYHGQSKMSFTSLMLHGMSAISVFSDVVIGRIIFGLALLAGLFTFGVAAVLYLKYATEILVPGYATTVILILSSILLNAITVGFLSILTLLSGRSQIGMTIDHHRESLVGARHILVAETVLMPAETRPH